jgi:hypothetical protein
MFIDAIHHPAPTPTRCYQLGQVVKQAIDGWKGGARVGVYASGGLSHYTLSFPYHLLKGTYGGRFGHISEGFDLEIKRALETGEGARLANLSAQDLLEHGEHELRSWITIAGMVGRARARILAWEAIYRAHMQMGVAYWDLEA